MKIRRQLTLESVEDNSSKKELIDYLKMKNLKGGNNGKNCPPPFEVDKKK